MLHVAHITMKESLIHNISVSKTLLTPEIDNVGCIYYVCVDGLASRHSYD